MQADITHQQKNKSRYTANNNKKSAGKLIGNNTKDSFIREITSKLLATNKIS